MNLKERIQKLCKDSGVSMNKVETDLEFGKGYISKLGKSTPNATKIRAIADYFGVTVDYLMTGNDTMEALYTCPDCDFSYVTTEYEDSKRHIEIHEAWKKAIIKFGKLYSNSAENEEIKARNRNIRDDQNNTLEERYNAELEVLRCLFSRSVSASDYDLRHVTYDEYVAMMMYGKKYRQCLGDDLYEKIVNNFGTMPGIIDGETYYHIPPKPKVITKKDTRDIKKDLDSIIEKLSSKEYGPAAYDGEELSEESAALFKDELEIALKRLKLINKEKYNPNKSKK